MPADTAPDRHPEVAAFLAAHPGIRFVEAFTPDLTGFGFGKRLPIAEIDALYRSGMGFSAAPYVLDGRHLGYGSGGVGWDDGDPDARGRPIPGSLKPMPWAAQPTAQVMLDLAMSATGEPLWTDPRQILKGVLGKLAADGFHPVVACEFEFFLIDGARAADGRIRPPVIKRTGRPLGYPTNLAVSTLEEVADWSAALDDAARAQGVPMGAVIAEMGVGQFEVNLHHQADALRAGDQAVLLKRLIRGVSRAMGWDATFMPKPYAEDAGSGLHVHVSLADAHGDNVFADLAAGEARLRAAVAGLQRTLPEALGFFAPNRNAFRRFGGLFAPVNRKWGEDNRTVAFRVPTDKGAGRRIEHRVAGADANPYLVLAAILAGMHHGIRAGLEPDAPVVGKHAGHKKDESLPGDVYEAARRLAAARTLKDYMPKRYLETYAHLLHGLHEEFLDELSVREYEFFL
ncbi:glutamine synthetase family protein [Labrys wisconsinensis]|uniref:Glutamine synthetase n=1 Tax=Labrys wisconsinensis TaxID=425677 RepID=A0ABU0JA28_9HYPH|nr:glutamine synthetase family protein [Labrys wisconsinensis]MDQ0471113.1 glutamine synthetase [Labrys wisconsinensis]